MHTISVIIPIYNTEEFLEECLSSVLNQTYPNLEILLINDGSSVNCSKTAKKYSKRDTRVTYYHFPNRKGVGAARNFGLKKATGKYVYFLDSDDYLEHDTLQLLAQNIGEQALLKGKMIHVTKREDRIQTTEEPVLRNQKSTDFKIQTALHTLILREFAEKHRLRFSEKVECYSDLEFIVPAMIHVENVAWLSQCFYYKRVRNDPISNPSLNQLAREQRIADFLKIYNSLRDGYDENEQAAEYLDRRFLTFYQKTIVPFLENERHIDTFFDPLSRSAKKINLQKLKKKRLVVQREIKWLVKGRKANFSRVIKWHLRLKKLKKALKSKRNLYIQLYRSLFMRIPLKTNTVVFESFLGKHYACNPKYIYEYMLNNKMDFEYVWILNDTRKSIPGHPKKVKRFSLAYYYYLATSKYWVSNSRMPLHLNKREGNIYLQTWHGTPLKKLVFDITDIHSANPRYKQHFYQQSRRWDYLISANPYSTDIFRRAFKYEKEMIEVGYPRNDLLYSKNRTQLTKRIKQKLRIPLDKKVILYAPTWRDDEFYAPGQYKFAIKLDLQKMMSSLAKDYVILLRMHYFIADQIDTKGFEHFVYNLSNYDDIAELYTISDILITDYSSVFFDYAHLRRPILFYTYDLEKYRDTLRGFYLNLEKEAPGPLLKTTTDVIDAIRHIDAVQAEYESKYDAFYNAFCGWDNGKAAEQIVQHVFTPNRTAPSPSPDRDR